MIVDYEIDYSFTHGYSIMAIDETGKEFRVASLDDAAEAEKYVQAQRDKLASSGKD